MVTNQLAPVAPEIIQPKSWGDWLVPLHVDVQGGHMCQVGCDNGGMTLTSHLRAGLSTQDGGQPAGRVGQDS